MEHKFKVGQIVAHIKSGNRYVVDRFCVREHDAESCVVYGVLGEYKFYVWPESEFNEKFTALIGD